MLRAPEVFAVTVAALVVTDDLVAGPASPAVLLVLLGTTFVVALRGARWWAVLAVDAAAFAIVDPHAAQVSDLTFTGGLCAVTYLAGWAVWARMHRVGALELEAREVAARQERLLAAAVEAERAAMAVELHDIVTHAVSGIVVQAQAARRGGADAAAGGLSAIEETARSAMTELRRLLTLLSSVRAPHEPVRTRAGLRDGVLALLVAGLGELELWSGERYNGHLVWPGPRWFSALLVIALAGSLLLRRRRPATMATLVFGLLVGEGLVVGSTEAATGPVVLVAASFSAAAYGVRWLVLVPLASVACGVFALEDNAAQGLFDRLWMFGLAVLALVVGGAVRARQRRIADLEKAATATAAEHAQRLEQALASERAALALELHDIVSHAISVIVIQAQAGSRRPDSAADALDAIEASARTALSELRRLLALLLPDDQHAHVRRPTPSLRQLDELLLSWRTAGLHVELSTDDLPKLPPAVDLAAYRIVQESLTNSARHAPGARVKVALTLVGDQLEVTTRDFCDGSRAGALGAGRGLVGMRKRIELVGGELLAAGQAADGFLVHARLPLTSATA